MSDYGKNLEVLIDKVEGVNDLSWADLCDMMGLDVHPDSLRKAFYNTDYSGYYVAKYLMEKNASELTDEMMDRLQDKKNEEYKERVRLQDARREYNKTLREEARFENLVEVMQDSIRDLPELRISYSDIATQNHAKAALLLSDIHYGALIDNVLNLYNTDVCRERMETLLNKTIKYCTVHGVGELYVNLCGDLVSGNIRVTSRVEQEEDIITQTMEVAELLSQFLMKLSEHAIDVIVVCVQGNHSRVTADINQSLNPENFERIVFDYIHTRLPELKMIRNGLEDWVAYKIGERKIYVEHGDKSAISSAKENATNLLGYAPDDIFFGHFHHMEISDKCGTDVVVNGSVMGADSYAVKCRLNTKPYQVLRVYNGEDVCTYKLML